jgi:hypothetical protein
MRALVCLLLAGCYGDLRSEFVGTYDGNYSGTYDNTTPISQSGSNSEKANITVSLEPGERIKLSWQVAGNPPSGTIIFDVKGQKGDAIAGTGATGNCFMGRLSNGDLQTTCCKTCKVEFSGKTFTQTQDGEYTGTNSMGVPYGGTYSGTWTATRLER